LLIDAKGRLAICSVNVICGSRQLVKRHRQ